MKKLFLSLVLVTLTATMCYAEDKPICTDYEVLRQEIRDLKEILNYRTGGKMWEYNQATHADIKATTAPTRVNIACDSQGCVDAPFYIDVGAPFDIDTVIPK